MLALRSLTVGTITLLSARLRIHLRMATVTNLQLTERTTTGRHRLAEQLPLRTEAPPQWDIRRQEVLHQEGILRKLTRTSPQGTRPQGVRRQPLATAMVMVHRLRLTGATSSRRGRPTCLLDTAAFPNEAACSTRVRGLESRPGLHARE